jgi:hypothetical protein
MLLSRRDVIRKNNEAPAHLQERNALGRVTRLFCGICAVVCLVQILAPCSHLSASAMFTADITQNAKSRFHGSALELTGGRQSKNSVKALAAYLPRLAGHDMPALRKPDGIGQL